MTLLVEEIRLLEVRIAKLERELTAMARQSPACATLLSIPGVGLLTATAMVGTTSGEVSHFRDARHFASWFGLTPKEHSPGGARHLGRISKRGDRYLRMLLTHGARAVLRAASVATHAGKTVDPLRHWALAVQGRSNHNKATCALANKLARICYATLRDGEPYGAARLKQHGPQIPCRHGPSRAHYRCRIYDCRLTPTATTIDQPIALRGESIYGVRRHGDTVPLTAYARAA